MPGTTFCWPKVSEFDVHRARNCIVDYIETFSYSQDLKYYVDYMKQYVDDNCMQFVYEVKWSKPTNQEPLQKVTASMYFTLTIPFEAAPDSTVEVTYSYECSNIILKPGQSPFKENWINRLMNYKLNFIAMQEKAFGVYNPRFLEE
ncbi:A-kinase anchor protein 14 [Nilaparvata lugens]|uniref:A-kinase anchor protein 14 n=1 Tax=Nilaparvata lugens TaxID=108931 RepID=UPI00193E6B81|nr:A-kinase anchor protein 14 [Nilaparvata lugens]XP_022204912.2 A-kinase anchor protein 14 [Nilaparvata lugens]